MSKGSKRRPCQVSREEFARNWDAAFAKPEPEGCTLDELAAMMGIGPTGAIVPLNVGDVPAEKPKPGGTQS